jgi:hypothetical protein
MEGTVNNLRKMFTKGFSIHRLHSGSNINNKIISVIAIFSLSIILVALEDVQVAAALQQENINNNNNSPKLSLSTISTAVGTGAAAAGAVVTVPGVLRTRKQTKCLSTYPLKIHNKYDEFCKKQHIQTIMNI